MEANAAARKAGFIVCEAAAVIYKVAVGFFTAKNQGLLLCRSKDTIFVEYAARDLKPPAISQRSSKESRSASWKGPPAQSTGRGLLGGSNGVFE